MKTKSFFTNAASRQRCPGTSPLAPRRPSLKKSVVGHVEAEWVASSGVERGVWITRCPRPHQQSNLQGAPQRRRGKDKKESKSPTREISLEQKEVSKTESAVEEAFLEPKKVSKPKKHQATTKDVSARNPGITRDSVPNEERLLQPDFPHPAYYKLLADNLPLSDDGAAPDRSRALKPIKE